MKITDVERMEYLRAEGYIPYEEMRLMAYLMDKKVDATVLLDYCLERGYGPAYWREREVDPAGLWVETISPNGLVFVRNCDRERIDGILSKVFQLPVVTDESVPLDGIHFQQQGRMIGKIVNIEEKDSNGEWKSSQSKGRVGRDNGGGLLLL